AVGYIVNMNGVYFFTSDPAESRFWGDNFNNIEFYIASVDSDYNYGEFSEVIVVEPSWTANFNYDEATGKIFFDNFPTNRTSGEAWSCYAIYPVYVNGDLMNEVVWNCYDDGGYPCTPSINVYGLLAKYSAINGETAYNGDITITVKAASESNYNWNGGGIPASDSITINYQGGNLDSDIEKPTNILVYGFDTTNPFSNYLRYSPAIESIGCIICSKCPLNDSLSYSYSESCTISNLSIGCVCIDSEGHYFSVATIDGNGNYSEFTDFVELAADPNWASNIEYNGETGMLTWTEAPDTATVFNIYANGRCFGELTVTEDMDVYSFDVISAIEKHNKSIGDNLFAKISGNYIRIDLSCKDSKDNLNAIYSKDFVAIRYNPDDKPELKATSDNGIVKLEWEAIEDADLYSVQVLEDGSWKILDNTAETTYTDTDVIVGETYEYRVIPCFDELWSVPSDTASVKVAVSTPENVKAEADDISITITWDEVSGATKYRVQRSEAGGSWKTMVYPTKTSYIDSDIVPGVTYSYRVLAYVSGKWSNPSEAVSAMVEINIVPENLKAVAGDSKVTLTWDAVEGATKYRVQRHNGSAWATVSYPATNTYVDTGLTNDTTYKYRVLAYAGDKWSTPSEPVSATPEAMNIPQNLKAVAGDSKVTLSWDAVKDATKYRVQRNSGSSWTTVSYPTTNTYVDKGLTNGSTYKYRVLAYVDGAWTTASAVVTATPEATSIPQNVTAVAGNGKVTLSWDEVSGATKYRVQCNTGTAWSTVSYPTATTYTHTGLTNGTAYKYRVLAYVDGAWTTASVVVTATPTV
ncbi:MAG: fibronectin type III domain-containing protein, partial [Ruminiclostridium sp.]|nr:fibronectin type III domain-containing protein [Ruminiclostridium sp.]